MCSTRIALGDDHPNLLPEEARRHRLAQIAALPDRSWRRGATGNRGADAFGRRRPVAVALVGLAVMGISAITLAMTIGADKTSRAAADTVGATASHPAEVSTADLVYEPGHSSGWHVHPGVHSVVVLSGTLSVYDGACRRHDYGPGQTYLGGREPHLARNTGVDAVALAVTYVSDSTTRSPGTPVAAPTGCEAA